MRPPASTLVFDPATADCLPVGQPELIAGAAAVEPMAAPAPGSSASGLQALSATATPPRNACRKRCRLTIKERRLNTKETFFKHPRLPASSSSGSDARAKRTSNFGSSDRLLTSLPDPFWRAIDAMIVSTTAGVDVAAYRLAKARLPDALGYRQGIGIIVQSTPSGLNGSGCACPASAAVLALSPAIAMVRPIAHREPAGRIVRCCCWPACDPRCLPPIALRCSPPLHHRHKANPCVPAGGLAASHVLQKSPRLFRRPAQG
jgi:hypothetical protein